MKFYLFPKYMEEASKSGWIVKMFKALGVINVVLCILFGWVFGGNMATAMLVQARMDRATADMVGPLLGFAGGIFAGLISSLVFFAAAQALDDLHALRVQTEAYVAFETEEIKMGR